MLMTHEFESTAFASITLLTLGIQTGLATLLYRHRFGSVSDHGISKPMVLLHIRATILIQIWFGAPAVLLELVIWVLSLSLSTGIVQLFAWSATILSSSVFQVRHAL